MGQALAELAEITDQHQFNCSRWEEVQCDPVLNSLEQRIETNEFGAVIMMPPPGFEHSNLQSLILGELSRLMPESGRALTECPLSTSGGVKGVDVVWVSNQRVTRSLQSNILTESPEICVEVLSPSNTRKEIEEKKRLYFESGAEEFWICSSKGTLSFYGRDGELSSSKLCPDFPSQIDSSWP